MNLNKLLSFIFTPFKIFIFFYFGLFFFTPLNYVLGWFLFYVLILLAADILMLVLIKNKSLISLIQSLIITGIFLFFFIQNKISNYGDDITKTIIIPNDIKESFVFIVYEVEGAAPLSSEKIMEDFNLNTDTSLIILTCSKLVDDKSQTTFVNTKNQPLNNRFGKHQWSFYEIMPESITCGNKSYQFKQWYIGKEEIYKWDLRDIRLKRVKKIICNR